MGYENNERPSTADLMIDDVMADLSDLKFAIECDAEKERLIKAVEFIRETLKQYRAAEAKSTKRLQDPQTKPHPSTK
jgi:hypothetical protein